MKYSPLLLIVYTRLDNLNNLVTSLLENEDAKYTDIYVISDAASKESDIPLVSKVREYCKKITGFNNTYVIEPEINSRLCKKNYILNTMKLLVEKYGAVITLEDDNIVSKYFLSYMNEALDYYKDYPNIGAICGYSLPIKIPNKYKYDIYLGARYSPWGVGFTKKWFEQIDRTKWDRYAVAIKKENIKKFKNVGKDILSILKEDSEGKIEADDVRTCFYHIMNNIYCVFPVKSLVRNVGFDGSGEHCNKTSRFDVDINNEEPISLNDALEVNKTIQKRIRRYEDNFTLSAIMRKILFFIPKFILTKMGLLSKFRNFIYK